MQRQKILLNDNEDGLRALKAVTLQLVKITNLWFLLVSVNMTHTGQHMFILCVCVVKNAKSPSEVAVELLQR